MDSSGNNRFELLFMDDDAATPTATVEVAAKKKQNTTNTTSTTVKKTKAPAATSTGAAAASATTANKKTNPNCEKENKAGALNKNDAGKKTAAATNAGIGGGSGSGSGQQANRPKQSSFAGNNNKRRQADEGGARVTFKSERPYRSDNAGGSSGGGGGSGFGGNNGEVTFRRNFREGGSGGGNTNFSGTSGNEFNNEQRPPRQYRDNRGPPRNRFGENNYRSGKREYDRQSGSDKTGVKAIDKRDGAGAHNWGSVKQDIEDINKSNDTTTDTEAALTDKEESANEQSPDATAVQEEEEAKEMTLDEWKAMQKHTKPQFNIRKAGEGEDTSQWKKMVVLNKKKDAADSEEELEYDPSMYPQRVGRLQRIVDIQFTFNDGRRGGGFGRGRGRGGRPGGMSGGPGRFDNAGRGGAAGGGGGGGGVGGAGAGGVSTGSGAPVDRPISDRPRNYSNKPRGNNNALKVDDERQFPTLS